MSPRARKTVTPPLVSTPVAVEPPRSTQARPKAYTHPRIYAGMDLPISTTGEDYVFLTAPSGDAIMYMNSEVDFL